MKARVLALALLAAPAPAVPAQLHAQSAMTRAIGAYQSLDFDRAATLLRRILATDLADSTRIQALTYLGAAEHSRGQQDSARAVFRTLVQLAPRYQPDTLVFPPEITRLYNDVSSSTQVAALPPVTPAAPPPAPPPPPPPAAPPPASRAAPPSAAREPRSQTERITATGAGTIVNVQARSEAGGAAGLPPASGTVLGIAAAARLGAWEFGIRYLQGSLGTRDLVEGAAALRFRAAPWMTLQLGPQIRRYDASGWAERWVTWQLGARTDVPLGARFRGHATAWHGLGLSVNVPPGSGTANGGEIGVTMDMATAPFWFGLGYAIDQASVRGGGRRETVHQLTLSAGVRRS